MTETKKSGMQTFCTLPETISGLTSSGNLLLASGESGQLYVIGKAGEYRRVSIGEKIGRFSADE